MDSRTFKEEPKIPPVTDNKIHVRPWVETNDKRGSIAGGISISMSLEKLGQLLSKLKFWKRNPADQK